MILIRNQGEIKLELKIEISDLLQLIDQLEIKDLQYVNQQITDKVTTKTKIREKELLEKIDLDVPESDLNRYDELRKYMLDGKMTEKQHKELMALSKKREQLNVERMIALVELSKIRNMHIEDLMKSLNAFPPSYVE